MDRAFDKLGRAWRRGADTLIQDYQLPSKGWLLFGMSRGAQWAHRIALREPDLFAAVHIHINSSYDAPTKDANQPLWLVTTGKLEAGFPAAKRFYASARTLGYPMIFFAEPKLGHGSSKAVDRLSVAFFEYVMSRKANPAASASNERFVGNYFTHEFVPVASEAQVPAQFRVYLPTRKLAEAWGIEAEASTGVAVGSK